jgi:hypothetical protein
VSLKPVPELDEWASAKCSPLRYSLSGRVVAIGDAVDYGARFGEEVYHGYVVAVDPVTRTVLVDECINAPGPRRYPVEELGYLGHKDERP